MFGFLLEPLPITTLPLTTPLPIFRQVGLWCGAHQRDLVLPISAKFSISEFGLRAFLHVFSSFFFGGGGLTFFGKTYAFP